MNDTTVPAVTDDVRLGSWTWPKADDQSDRLLFIPVGSTEQHGMHLPLDTDTRIASTIAHGAATVLGHRVAVAPDVPYGASGEHADFPGTLSIGAEALATVLVELGRSADSWHGVVFVNGHGGNGVALQRAVAALRSEGRRAMSWSWAVPGADAHAGHTETSLMLAIAPDLVHLDAAVPGRLEPIGALLEELRSHGVRAVSPNGVLGDPTGATAALGQSLLDQVIAALVDAIKAELLD